MLTVEKNNYPLVREALTNLHGITYSYYWKKLDAIAREPEET